MGMTTVRATLVNVRRKMGEVRFEIQGREGVSKVIFGRAGDSSLLGMVTLEILGLSLDPLKLMIA